MSSYSTTTARGRIVGSETPTVFNLSMPLANTEYSFSIPDATHKFTIRTRLLGELRIAFAPGDTATNWITVRAACNFPEDNIDTKNVTIYLRSSVGGNTAEILTWS